jgi:hypothetical protein
MRSGRNPPTSAGAPRSARARGAWPRTATDPAAGALTNRHGTKANAGSSERTRGPAHRCVSLSSCAVHALTSWSTQEAPPDTAETCAALWPSSTHSCAWWNTIAVMCSSTSSQQRKMGRRSVTGPKPYARANGRSSNRSRTAAVAPSSRRVVARGRPSVPPPCLRAARRRKGPCAVRGTAGVTGVTGACPA